MNRILLAISLILIGIFFLIRWAGLVSFQTETAMGISLSIFGLLNANISLGNNNRKGFLISSILFLGGISLLVKSIFFLPDTRGLVLVSILFISGSALVVLFLENTTQKIFLWSGVLLIGLSIISLTLLRMIGLFRFTNQIANLFGVFWPIILTLFGMSLFINRKK